MRSLALVLALGLPATASAVPAGWSGQLSGSSTPTGLAISDDERFVVKTHAGNGGVTVFDRTSFLDGGTNLSVCSDARDVEFVTGAAIDDRFYVGCTDGEVYHLTPRASAFPATWTVSDPITLSLADVAGDVVALDFAPADTVVHAVLQNDGFYSLWTVPLSDDIALRVAPSHPGLGTIAYSAIGEDGAPWILADSASLLHHVQRVGSEYAVLGTSLTYNRVTGLAISNALDTVYVADADEGEVWTVPASAPLLGASEHPGVVSGPVALALGGRRASPFLWLGEAGGELVGLDADGDELFREDLDGQNAAAIAPVSGVDGAVYVAGTGGVVRMVTDRPFVSLLDADATRLGPGEEYTLTFAANADVEYELRVAADLDPDGGSRIAAGSLEVDVESSVTLQADDLPLEGANRVYLFVDSGADDLGVDSIVLTFDGPPDALATPTVGVADEELTLRWMASDEPDIATFEVYLADAPFTSDALPAFVTADGMTWPRTVTAGEPSAAQSVAVKGLTNNTLYYLAVRAQDEGGQLSPLSDVVSGTPRDTCGAAECAGEPLGCSTCSSLASRDPAVPLGAWLLLGLCAWLLRRR